MEIINEVLYRPLFNALIFLYNTVAFHDLGVAIIILTAIIRGLLWPSQAKALRSQRALQKLQPKLEEIRKKYKDKERQTKETLEFYRRHKVSPFSSCLPTLIQLPIIIALYQVFRYSLDSASLSALYPFISRPETVNSISFGILDLSQPNRIILPILTGGLQFVQSWMMMRMSAAPAKSDPASAISRQMMYVFPLVTVFIAMGLPAALPLYWIVTTIFAIVQQWFIMREGEIKLDKGKKGVRIKVRTRQK